MNPRGSAATVKGRILVVALVSFAGGLSAQNPGFMGYLIEGWRTERGLPQNTVTGIAQTSDGYLWVSTVDGLARFDGTRPQFHGLLR